MINSSESNTETNSETYTTSRRRAWFGFFMLFMLMLSDYADRQIIVSLFPHLKEEWSLSDKQLGALVSVISIVVAIGSIPVALLADKFGRVKSIFAMATVWSMATIACMFARNYGQLFAARAVVGVGETGYGAVGAALISRLFPRRLHATLLGAFFAAASLGSVLGVILGGVIADNWGWRAAFGAVGFPGLLMALLFLLVPDYKNVIVQFAPKVQSRGPVAFFQRMYQTLVHGPTILWVCLAGALQLISLSTVWAWLPSFLNRYHSMSVTTAAKHAAVVVLLCALGAVFWGWVADRVSQKTPRNKLLLMSVLTVMSCLLLATAFGGSWAANTQYGLILMGGFFASCTVGVTSSTVLHITHPGLRATGSAVLALFQNLFGLAIGPFLGGVLSDYLGLHIALAMIPFVSVLSAMCFVRASRTYEADMLQVAAANTPAAAPRAARNAPMTTLHPNTNTTAAP